MRHDFIVVNMLPTNDKMAIKKDCVIAFYEDNFKINERYHQSHEIEYVKIEYISGKEIEWVMVSNSFESILMQMKDMQWRPYTYKLPNREYTEHGDNNS